MFFFWMGGGGSSAITLVVWDELALSTNFVILLYETLVVQYALFLHNDIFHVIYTTMCYIKMAKVELAIGRLIAFCIRGNTLPISPTKFNYWATTSLSFLLHTMPRKGTLPFHQLPKDAK